MPEGKHLRLRLSVMMFLQHFGMGAWLVTLTSYLSYPRHLGGLGFHASLVGWVYSTMAIGAITAPMFIGLLADRLFAGERVMSFLSLIASMLIGASGLWCETQSAAGAVPADIFWTLFACMSGYCFCALNCATLCSVISLRNLHEPHSSFGKVRLVGTFGWIVAGFVVGWVLNPISAQPLYLASCSAMLLAIFALTLPHTPPIGKGKPIGEVMGLPALKLFRDFSFGVFVAVAFMMTIFQQFYSLFIPPYLRSREIWRPEVVMTIGQDCEMCCMALIPFFYGRLGLKRLMLLGLLGWVVRNAFLVWGNIPGILLVALPMQGWSYTFFFIVAALYIDREAPPHLRAGAQGLLTIISLGPGWLIGNWLSSYVVESCRGESGVAWAIVWFVPLVGCSIATLVFALLFHEPPVERPAVVQT